MDIKRYITESNAIEDIYEQKEIEQSLFAWKYISKLQTISHYDICRLQKMITINQKDLKPNERGYYRSFSKVNVKVGDYKAPDFSEVDELMKKWLEDLPKMTPLIAHIRFEHIHPFVDGNGRVGRMIYWWHCTKSHVKPKLYTAKKAKRYYDMFSKKRIEWLQKSNWGIGYLQKFTWEAVIKTSKGLRRAGFFEKPTDESIRLSIPEGEKLISVISTKELK